MRRPRRSYLGCGALQGMGAVESDNSGLNGKNAVVWISVRPLQVDTFQVFRPDSAFIFEGAGFFGRRVVSVTAQF